MLLLSPVKRAGPSLDLPGNTPDVTTVQKVKDDRARNAADGRCSVGDGTYSRGNLEELAAAAKYILATLSSAG
ncbi:MAG: hypothetical protein R3D03_21275 [Geminicoccaceae bacterium]